MTDDFGETVLTCHCPMHASRTFFHDLRPSINHSFLILITQSTIRCRALLLRDSIEIVLYNRNGNNLFTDGNNSECRWFAQSQLYCVTDAIYSLSASQNWSLQSNIVCCWTKSRIISKLTHLRLIEIERSCREPIKYRCWSRTKRSSLGPTNCPGNLWFVYESLVLQ